MASMYCYNPDCRTLLNDEDVFCPNLKCKVPLILSSGRGTYRFRSIAGAGGFGHVYEVVDISAGNRRCAIKRIIEDPPRLTEEHIKHEVDTLLAHASRFAFLPDVYDYWKDGNLHYLVMQFIEGETLDVLRKPPWPQVAVTEFLIEMLDKLRRLHKANIIHRDIKPKNIKYSDDRGYTLLDFGLASKTGATVHPALTPDYAPPEQRTYNRPTLPHTDQRSDLYSLAATAYFLLCGRPPIIQERPSDGSLAWSLYVRPLHPELREMLQSMLQLNPDQRPRNAQMVLAKLKQIDLELLHTEYDSTTIPTEPLGSDDGYLWSGTPIFSDSDSIRIIEPRDLAEAKEAVALHATSTTKSPNRDTKIVLQPPAPSTSLGEEQRGKIYDLTLAAHESQLIVASARGLSRYTIKDGVDLGFEPLPSSVLQVSYTNDRLFVADNNGVSELRGTEQRPVHRWPQPIVDCRAHGAAHGQRLALIADGQLTLLNVGPEASSVVLVNEGACAVALNLPGDRLTVAIEDRIKVLQFIESGNETLLEITTDIFSVQALAFNSDGTLLAVAYQSNCEIWSVDEQRRLNTVSYSSDIDDTTSGPLITDVSLTPSGEYLAIASKEWVQLFRLSVRQKPQLIHKFTASVLRIAFSPASDALVACSSEQIWLLNLPDGKPYAERHDHNNSVYSIAVSPDGNHLVTSGEHLRRWSLRGDRLELAQTIAHSDRGQNGLAFSPNGELLLVGSAAGLQLWQTENWTIGSLLPGVPAQAYGVTFTTDGTSVLNVSKDGVESLSISNSVRQLLPAPLEGAFDVAFAGSGGYLVAYHEQIAVVCDAGGVHQCILETTASIRSAALSDDGTFVALATSVAIELWRYTTGPELIKQLHHVAHRLVFGRNGQLLALASGDKIVIYNLSHGSARLVRAIDQAHHGAVTDLVFMPDGSALMSAGQDGAVFTWSLSRHADRTRSTRR